jgi:hypothetical protein
MLSEVPEQKHTKKICAGRLSLTRFFTESGKHSLTRIACHDRAQTGRTNITNVSPCHPFTGF